VLAVANHQSYADGFIQSLGHHRVPRWMGKQEVFRWGPLRHWFRAVGVFPVARGEGDLAAIAIGKLMLEGGQMVVVYAEGTRIRHDDGLGTPRSGAARLALATGAPVLPMVTYGLKPGTGRRHLPRALRWVPFTRRTTTIYGPPLRFECDPDASLERIAAVRDEIWEQMRALYDIARDATVGVRRPRCVELPTGERLEAGIAPRRRRGVGNGS
jgi:1-acyl-sn-glycerol-3-phosphate acyltransferase